MCTRAISNLRKVVYPIWGGSLGVYWFYSGMIHTKSYSTCNTSEYGCIKSSTHLQHPQSVCVSVDKETSSGLIWPGPKTYIYIYYIYLFFVFAGVGPIATGPLKSRVQLSRRGMALIHNDQSIPVEKKCGPAMDIGFTKPKLRARETGQRYNHRIYSSATFQVTEVLEGFCVT